MVSFHLTLLASLAMVAPLVALDPAHVVSSINLLSQKSQALQAPANSINLINGGLFLAGQDPFPGIIAGFNDIVSSANTIIISIENADPVKAGTDSDKIHDAFREFVRVQGVLTNILIGKAGLLSTVPYVGQPVATVIKQIETVVDSLTYYLAEDVPSRASDLHAQARSLDTALETCIKRYQGLLTSKRSPKSPRREIVALI